MPIQPPQWTEFLSCPVCYKKFNDSVELPISLGCGHTVCKACLLKLHQKKCPFDQAAVSRSVEELPVNLALLQLVGATVPEQDIISISSISENYKFYDSSRRCISDLASHLKCLSTGTGQINTLLSRPMQRKLVTMLNCQLVEEEGRSRAMRAARSLGERSVTELILAHQNPTQLSTNLWAAIRARGCQFLGPAMQEEVLKLILLALEDGSPLSRKVLVLFVVQRLESQYPQASKTAIGHVVQLLYRASCFKVTKREEESSLMQLKEDFRTYEFLRREHDSQVVQIATEAGLRIAPEQWSSLLYGDTAHKSHMQSIIDKLQTPQSFAQSVNELVIALPRTGDMGNLTRLCPHLELLANIDPSPDAPPPTWENLEAVLKAVRTVVQGLVDFLHFHSQKKPDQPTLHSTKYKTSLCRDHTQKGTCPRGANCTFAHSQEELERARGRNKKLSLKPGFGIPPALPAAPLPSERVDGEEGVSHTQLPVRSRRIPEKSPDLTVDGEPEPSPVEPIIQVTPSPVSVASPLPPMIAPATVMSPMRPPMYPGGIPFATGPPREDYVPSNIQSHRVPGVSPYSQPHYMSEGIYYPQHGVSTFPGSFTTDVPGQYPTGVGYPAPPTPHPQNAHPYPSHYHMSGVYEHRYPGPASYTENWPPNVPFYMHPETTYPHPLPPRYAPTPHIPYQDQPPKETLDDLHQRRKKILVHLNQAPAPLTTTPENVGYGSILQSPVLPSVSGSGGYRQHSVPVSTSSIMLPSLDRRPPSSQEMVKSVADTYVASRSLSTLSLSEKKVSSESRIYTPWSSGESFTVTSDILTDAGTRATPQPEKYAESEEDFDLYKEIADQMREGSVDSLTPVISSTFSSHASVSLVDRNGDSSPKSTISTGSLLDDDFFIPFDPPIVSKYGPISRTSKAKLKSSDPVLVTAKSDSHTVTPVTAVTPTTRPYPVSVHTPSRFAPKTVPSQLRPDAKPFTSMMSVPAVGRVTRESTGGLQPYTLWESPGNMYTPQSKDPTVQDRLKHELAMVEHQIHIRENSKRELSDKEKLQCELQAIEKHISLKTGKPPNASLETSNRTTPSGKTQRTGNYRKIIPKRGPVLDADIDLNAALTPEEEQELNDLHQSLQGSKTECEDALQTDSP